VLVTHGSSEAIYLIMGTLLAAGDEVVVLDPCYPQHFSVAEGLGCHVKRWPLRFENGFRPDMSEARRIIVPGTRMVVVNFPNNPTGATLTVEEQQELLRLVEAAGSYLLWDGAFAELTYDQPPLPDPAAMAAMSERVLSIGTLSKAYGLPGLRVGWCLAVPELLRQLVQTRDHMTLHLSPLVELVAERTIEHGDKIVAIRREQARRNLAILSRWLDEVSDLIDWVPPAGGVCAFIRFRRFRESCAVDELCHRLARELRVLLIPGSCFGHLAHARLGFGDSTQSLCLGLSRLLATLNGPVQVATVTYDGSPQVSIAAGGNG